METKNIQLNIYQKLLEAQKEIASIKKDKENPFFHSSYADINSYIQEVKPILNKNGLIILQPLISIKKRTAIKTVIVDVDTKDEVKSIVKLPENPDPQKMGSIITYFRRYAIQSLLFLQAKDNDAEGVITRGGKEYKVETSPKLKVAPKVPIINEEGKVVPF